MVLSRRHFLTASATGVIGATTVALSEIAAPALATAPRESALSELSAGKRALVLGHDLSTLQQLEAVGRTFSDQGRVQPVEEIVARHGATHIRLRLWVDPPMAYNDLPHVLAMARRIKAAGLKLLLDLHYSD